MYASQNASKRACFSHGPDGDSHQEKCPLVVVHSADNQDYEVAHNVLNRIRQTYSRLKIVFADGAYCRCGLPGWVKEKYGVILQTILRPVEVQGF